MFLRLLNRLIARQPAAVAGGAEPARNDSLEECLEWGRELERAGALTAALESHRECVARFPAQPNAHLAEAGILAELWRIDECVDAIGRAHACAPNALLLFGEYLMWKHLVSRPDYEALARLHRQFGDAIAAAVPALDAARHAQRIDPERVLRIGYVSRNFTRHSVAFFAEPVIARHDRERFRVYCYHTHEVTDETTERIAAAADVWCDAAALDDPSLVQRILADEIDILVDLGGHTKLNRLRVFARKPAPVQVTWLGYPDTTGVRAIDYRITDTIADPAPEAEARHTERLLRLDPVFLCYQPPLDSPPVIERDGANGIVFGSFNMHAKLNTRAIDLWARIMKSVPGSRILIKSRPFMHGESAGRVRAAFETRGVDASRVDVRGWAEDRADHLGAYGEVDLALDTFPYNGTTTTCEALWMGVPVVTLLGEAHMARVGATLLTAAGLPELVAKDENDYVGIAVALARDAGRRAGLRRGMRERLRRSPLLDHAAYTRRLEAQLRDAWRAYCAGGAPRRPS